MFKTKQLLILHSKVELANGKKEHKEVGRVFIPTPTLQDFGISAEQSVYDIDAIIYASDNKTVVKEEKKGQPAFEDGIPLYADPVKDWLQQAITAKVAAMVRNRFAGGKLKNGAVIPEDFDQLTAETQRSGEALAIRRDAKASFEAHLQGKNKKAVTVQVLGDLFYNSAKVLQSAGEKYVDALSSHVSEWIPTLPEDKKSRFAPKILELQESINNAKQQTDLEDDLA